MSYRLCAALIAGAAFAAPQFGVDLARFEHARLAGPICAVWLAAFSIPFFLNSKDPGVRGASWRKAVVSGAQSVLQTLREATRYKELLKYLVARMFYADAMAALLALGAVYVALLRAIGARRRQVRRAVLVEALVVGAIGSVVGFLVGLGLASTRTATRASRWSPARRSPRRPSPTSSSSCRS